MKQKKKADFIGFVFWTMVFLCMIGGIIVKAGKDKKEREMGYVMFPSDEEIKQIEILGTK